MTFKIQTDLIRITKNKNNKFWRPTGLFYNISEVLIGDTWYKCSISFEKKNDTIFLQIFDPMLVDSQSKSILDIHTKGFYKELPTSFLQQQLIKIYLNTHSLNRLTNNLIVNSWKRKNSIIVFSVAIIVSMIYFIINDRFDNGLMKFIADNNWLQTIIMFITISGFINIFYPFTIKKQIDKNDIEEITSKRISRISEDMKNEKRAQF